MCLPTPTMPEPQKQEPQEIIIPPIEMPAMPEMNIPPFPDFPAPLPPPPPPVASASELGVRRRPEGPGRTAGRTRGSGTDSAQKRGGVGDLTIDLKIPGQGKKKRAGLQIPGS